MQRLYFVTLFLVLLLTASCSYSTDFFIINNSEGPIEVEYKVKVYPENPVLYDVPAKITISELENMSSSLGYQLEKLSNNQYQFDKETGIVKVRVMPGEALWISSVAGYSEYVHEDLERFFIQEISLKGPEGEIKYTKRQMLAAFSKVSKTLYTLTYR
jgi:hypothetical protein